MLPPLNMDRGEGRLESLVQLSLHFPLPLGLSLGVEELHTPRPHVGHGPKEVLVRCCTVKMAEVREGGEHVGTYSTPNVKSRDFLTPRLMASRVGDSSVT